MICMDLVVLILVGSCMLFSILSMTGYSEGCIIVANIQMIIS